MTRRSRLLWKVSPLAVSGLARVFYSLGVERQAPLPDPPYVLAANHYSHLDCPFISAAISEPIRYLALEDLFGVNRVLDWLIEGYGAIPTPREKRPVAAVRSALSALESGEIVGVFPESTRVSHWGYLQPKRGAAWLAIRADVPLVPVAIVGTGRVLGLDNKPHLGRVRVVTGPPISPMSGDSYEMIDSWAMWIGSQIGRYPDSEVEGEPRAFHQGAGSP